MLSVPRVLYTLSCNPLRPGKYMRKDPLLFKAQIELNTI